MRSALAGTASNVVALKTTAAVPMSVIERMFHLLWVPANNSSDRTQFLKLKLENLFRRAELAEKVDIAPFPVRFIHIYVAERPKLCCRKTKAKEWGTVHTSKPF